jgi:hypothetical protein
MINSNIYFEKLIELLNLQNEILKIIQSGNIVSNVYFENREKLVSQIVILEPSILNNEEIETKQHIIDIEKKILKESNRQFELSKLSMEQHKKATAQMDNYFKSQIDSQSEINLKV